MGDVIGKDVYIKPQKYVFRFRYVTIYFVLHR